MHQDEKWFLRNKKGDPHRLSKSLGVSYTLSVIMINRLLNDVDEAEKFLKPDLKDMHDPVLLKDMDKALDIIIEAINNKTKIMLVGDYDVDGIMGLMLLREVLSRFTSDITHCIPHRIEDGYGVNCAIVEKARDEGAGLMITCDNGISAFEPIELAKELGIKVVVTDHHDVPFVEGEDGSPVERLVAADAVVNPKQSGCGYPFKQLCGAAVAYKLVTALLNRLGVSVSDEDAEKLFIYAAVATVCDIVDLTDENRIFVHFGLEYINNKTIANTGLRALIEACELSEKTITTFDIGHILGPCINSTGRIDSAEKSYDLFNTDDYAKALELAASVREVNKERQDYTKDAFETAVSILSGEESCPDSVIILYIPDIHESVAGIVAGKVRDKYARPAIVLTDSRDDDIKGSGRSVDGYDMFSNLNKCRELLQNFGGHNMAVGLSLKKESLDVFREKVNANFVSNEIDLTPRVLIDMEYPIDFVGYDMIKELKLLEPHGKSNSRPLFAAKGVTIEYAALVGPRRNVIRLKLSSEKRKYVDAVFFGDSEIFIKTLALEPDDSGLLIIDGFPDPVDITYYPELNVFKGFEKAQLVIQNIRLAQ